MSDSKPVSMAAVQGDLTRLVVDATMNAASKRLPGGVEAALHRAAGPALPADCARP